MDAEQVLDLTALDMIRSLQQPGTEDLVSKIVAMFLEDSERYRGEIRQAIDDSDASRLGAAAHSLKSCAANVGAMQVSAVASRLEILGRNDALASVGNQFNDLETALAAARERLLRQLDS
ncbi:MAG: Hpt domain-containing protein [Pseudomonadota bacterium]